MKVHTAAGAWLDALPTDDEVIRAILSVPAHEAFTPRSSKGAKVRFLGLSVTVTAKKWDVNFQVRAEADVTNFEGNDVPDASGLGLRVEQKLALTAAAEFSIELDADATSILYDSGILPGNSPSELRLYVNGLAGTYWSFPTPYFKSIPMSADVKAALGFRIQGEGSGSFVRPTGPF